MQQAVQEQPADHAARLAFLYKALDDNQATIRFLDTKAAFGVAVLSGMVGTATLQLKTYFPLSEQPQLRLLLFLLFSVAALLAALLATRLIFPTVNPTKNIRMPEGLRPPFFIAELANKSWLSCLFSGPRFCKLKETHAAYLDSMARANQADLLAVMSAEVLKVSFIRQIKANRLRWFTGFLGTSAVLFVCLLVYSAVLAPLESKPASARRVIDNVSFGRESTTAPDAAADRQRSAGGRRGQGNVSADSTPRKP